MCFGGFGLGLFFEFLSFAIYHSSLFCYLRCFVSLLFGVCFFDVSFHLCLMVSLFSVVRFLWIHSLFWPRNRRDHREPWFFISFSMFCFFQYTSMLTPHNDLALSIENKERKSNEKQKPTKITKLKSKNVSAAKEDCGRMFVVFWGVFVGFWLTSCLCLACCFFCFFEGEGGAEWVFLFQSVSLLQKHNPPKNKTEKNIFQWFLVVLFCFCGAVFYNPQRTPHPKEIIKKQKKGLSSCGARKKQNQTEIKQNSNTSR